MKIYYLENSGFAIEADSLLFVFDYFCTTGGNTLEEGVVGDISSYERVYFMASHRHADHFSREIFSLASPNTYFILDSGITHIPSNINAFRISRSKPYDDGLVKVISCPSTDIGSSLFVEALGKRIFHAGDLNCWHWMLESTEEEERESRADFTNALDCIARLTDTFDIAFFPLDPRLRVCIDDGILEFESRFSPSLLVPMHMQGEYHLAQALCKKLSCPIFSYSHRGCSFEI